MKAKIEGTVVLRAIVRVDGIPSEITVDRGLEKGLDQKAVDIACSGGTL